MRRCPVVGLLAAAVLGLGPPVAQATLVPKRLPRPSEHQTLAITVPAIKAASHGNPDANSQISSNWSGYLTLQGQFNSVQATTTVPGANCPLTISGTNGNEASFWVGLDGWGSNTVQQNGIAETCDASGFATYFIWVEEYPWMPSVIQRVSPDDRILMNTTWNGSIFVYSFYINGAGQAWYYPEACPGACSRVSAEVITEDPGGAVAGGLYLTNYGNATYNGAVVDGARVTSFTNYHSIVMYDPAGQVMVQPGPYDDSSESFDTPFSNGS